MKKYRLFIYTAFIFIISSPFVGAQFPVTTEGFNPLFDNDSIPVPPLPADSLLVRTDSIATDSIPSKKSGLDAPVDYTANDSIVFTAGNYGYLYGKGKVDYQELTIEAENISMSMDSSIVTASHGIDSIGDKFGYPLFTDKSAGSDGKYEGTVMRYNFKSKKGFIVGAITEQGEGYIMAEKAKKNADDSFFMCDGRYTTCDHHDHPHFYLMLTKAKVRPKKNIVAGPSYLVIEDLPLPIGLPFGFFPFTDKYSSGVLMPSYVDEMDRGFGLRDGGYYFAINEYVDAALTGEIYTKGSWGVNLKSSYKKRYKYTGNVNFNYLYTKYGDKEDPDYSIRKDFRFTWSHSQDQKANMYRTLSANVNYSTSSYNRNQISQWGNTENTKNSTVTLTQRFPNSPISISANISAAQRSQDSTVSLTLPNLTVTMSRIYPFKRKDRVGDEKWYEKIQLSYTGDLRNSITTKEDQLLKSNLQRDWRNGMKHTIPISATFSAFNYLNITPSINYTERWYFQKVKQKWDPDLGRNVYTDTINSFNRVYDFNFSLSLQTKLYGFYEPLFKIGKLQKIRHVFTPSISFSGSPDFSDPIWGFYESYYYYDAYGNKIKHTYSPYENGIFGTAPKVQSGYINFSFENNVEMKVGGENDSTKVISLIDNLGINFSHNLMAKEFKWSDINTNLRLKLSKNLTVNLNAVWDPYTYDIDAANGGTPYRVNKLRISRYGTLARLRSTGYSISPSINQDTFKKWFGKGGVEPDKELIAPIPGGSETGEDEQADEQRRSLREKKEETGEYDADGYLKNQVQWTLSFNYSFRYAYSSKFDNVKKEYKYDLTHNFGFSGSIQPTKNWNFSFTTSYDFNEKKFAYINCNLSRNLHCWSITASFIPVGPYKSYFISLRASSQMLQDLKVDKRGRSSGFDPEWY